MLSATLRSRISALQEGVANAPKPSLKGVWPESGQPSVVSTGPPDESLWEEILVKFGASGVPAAREAQFFEEVIKAGMDANSVPFPQMELRQGARMTFVDRQEGFVQYLNEVPFPMLQPLANQWTSDVNHVEKEVVELVIAGRAKAPHQLRESSYSTPPLDMELAPWSCLNDGVIRADECTDAQLLVWEQRSKRPLSVQRLERRRAVLSETLKGEFNHRVIEEIRPELEREAAFWELQARWARDKATEAQQHLALAEQGAAFVAWVLPNERRWPAPCAAWMQRGKWFAMWRSGPLTASAFAFKPMKRSDSATSLSSWAAVSDVSWVDVESKASECGWDEVLDDQQPALAAADPAMHLSKADITEIKALSNPPVAVKLTMEVICILLEVPPIKLRDGVLNYWEPSKQLLSQPNFLTQVATLRHHVSAKALNAVAPYICHESFTPEVVKKSSLAAAGLCKWAREVYKYHTVGLASAGAMRQQLARKPAPELLAESHAALDTLHISLIQELKAMSKPPAGVAEVCSCLLYLFQGIDQNIALTKKGNAKASWRGFQTLASNPGSLLVQLRGFKDAIDAGTVPSRNIELARKVQIDMGLDFSVQTMKNKSIAAAGLCAWINNTIAYYDLVAPQLPEPPVRKEVAESEPVVSFCVDVRAIRELKSLGKPPQGVKDVLQAVAFLLGAEEAWDWGQCQHMIANPEKFVETLASFDAQNVSPTSLAQAKAIAMQPFFNRETLICKTAAVAGVAEWVLRVVELSQKTSMGA